MADRAKKKDVLGNWLRQAIRAEKDNGTKREQLLSTLDTAMHKIISDLPRPTRDLSFALYQASLAVAFHGPDSISAVLSQRAQSWHAEIRKRNKYAVEARKTRSAVRESTAPKSRIPESNAFEVVAKAQGISPSTAERRAYRKR